MIIRARSREIFRFCQLGSLLSQRSPKKNPKEAKDEIVNGGTDEGIYKVIPKEERAVALLLAVDTERERERPVNATFNQFIGSG